ncbi:MAG: DNA repair protein RecO [Anaerolineales bacterium]|nr:DNA repair protein RecO [Anaerolineales bacterium]
MAKPRVYKTEAIVLKRTNLGEADKILSLYTPNLGKIRAVAKGVRRPKSKLGGHVETLTRSSMMLAKGRNLDIITQSQTIDSFLPLRSDLWQTSCALYTAELVDRFTEEHIENYPVYKLLLSTINSIVEADDIDLLLRYFEIHLTSFMGYKPQLHSCINCKKELEPVENYFSASGGGVLCPNCRAAEPRVRPLSLNALKVMRLFQGSNYEQARKVKLNPGLSKELETTMREYIRYILEREVKSVEFLDQLRRT